MINKQLTCFTCGLSIFSPRWNHWFVAFTCIVLYTKCLLAFKCLAEFFLASLPWQLTCKESVFSFKLFKQYIDCFTSMCELITMAGSGCQKYCGVEKWWSENRAYHLKAWVLKIFPPPHPGRGFLINPTTRTRWQKLNKCPGGKGWACLELTKP